jgi:hypothetical protein
MVFDPGDGELIAAPERDNYGNVIARQIRKH